MSNRRYLEIDSTYRNRNQFPNPSNFEVLISQSGSRNAINAYDPISESAPIKTWRPVDLQLTGGVILQQIPPPPPLVNNNINELDEFIISFSGPTIASKKTDYYVGYPIQIDTNIVKITTWDVLSYNNTMSSFIVTVNPPLTSFPTVSDAVTFLPSINDYSIGLFLVPDGYGANFYYVGYILHNETLNQYRPIISYDGTLKIGGLNLSVESGGPINTWNDTHTYSIRDKMPRYIGALPASTTNTSSSFVVDPNTSISVGDFIRFTTTTSTNDNKVCKVTSYTGVGNPGDPSSIPPIPVIPPYVVTINNNLNIPVNGDIYEVLQFTRDNFTPFSYTGSLVSQQEMVCYEVELINLILPNKILYAGGRTAFYPYVYVELQNISGSSAGTYSVIYSNNPNSTRMLFRVAINDIANPTISPFIKIDGGKMVQTIKFKPNDNFKFGVYLPDGQILQTVEYDTLSPVYPDPLLQISALFQMKRL